MAPAPHGQTHGKAWAAFTPPTGLLKGKAARTVALLWLVFAAYGVVVDAIEMPYFADVQGLSAAQIGIFISVYGAGGVAVFLAATLFSRSTSNLVVSVVLAGGTVTWILGGGFAITLTGFAICGLGYALVNAALRNRIDHVVADLNAEAASDVWGWFFQVSLTCSAIGFGAASVYFALGGPLDVLVVLLVATCIALVVVSLWAQVAESRRGEGIETDVKSLRE